MPNAADYRPLPGRNRGNIREDGSSTRVKNDLFPEYIRHLTDDKRTIWDLVGRALCSSEVQAAFVKGLAPGLERRFGSDFANVGMYPIPVLTRDIPGYRITPHTDTQWKGITVQLYLPRDASATHIGTIFHERLPDGSIDDRDEAFLQFLRRGQPTFRAVLTTLSALLLSGDPVAQVFINQAFQKLSAAMGKDGLPRPSPPASL